MYHASYTGHPLIFFRPAGTSRGTLTSKGCWFLKILGEDGKTGLGEVSFVPGLSVEDQDDLEINLDHICKLINRGEMSLNQSLPAMPGIQFALETAMRDMEQGGERILFPSRFTRGREGIPTNGLIWMGDPSFMLGQIRNKLESGFRVLKMKVGAISPEDELGLLHRIRSEYGEAELEIRLDANGAWTPEEAPERMSALAKFRIHSIEQPIKAGQAGAMSELCSDPVIPVALDEELIGVTGTPERKEMLGEIMPSYIIIKPGLLGGFSHAREWIEIAGELGIGWWATSALESNIGLNAIAQWTYSTGVTIPQGLGTGLLYRNNIPSPLQMEGDKLWYRPAKKWDLHYVM